MWSLDVVGSPNPDQEVNRKVEELAWAASLIYGVSGWQKGPPFKADFVLYVSKLREYHIQAAESCFLQHAPRNFLRFPSFHLRIFPTPRRSNVPEVLLLGLPRNMDRPGSAIG